MLWSKIFPIPEKGRAKTPSGVQILVLKNFGSKISHRKVFYIKFDWNQLVFEEKHSYLENGQKLWKILYWGAIMAPPHVSPIRFHKSAPPVDRVNFILRFCA